MLNTIAIAGRLTRDPEIRTTQSGVQTASFTVACDRDFTSGGSKETDFFSCVAWRGTADFIGKWFKRGDMIVVSGRMQSRKYTGRDGNEKTVWECVVNNAYFGGSKRDDNEGGYTHAETADGAQNAAQSGTTDEFQEMTDFDPDLPF